ncbi:MAG TPA: gliding motility-associated C-terminal domain-containing protein [Puia sp.]
MKDHGVHLYDSLEWEALQWERSHPQQTPRSHDLLASTGVAGPRTATVQTVRPLSSPAAQPANNCGVKASFTPSNDSIIRPGVTSLITFTSTSTNATSVTWYENGLLLSHDNSWNFGEGVGQYEIMLVAQNGACTDTAVSYVYITGTQPINRDNIKAYYGTSLDDYSNDLAAVPAGGYLLGGYSSSNIYDGLPKGMMIKIAESGCIEWSKKISSAYQGQLYKVLALRDGGYACSGYNDSISYFMKLDAMGNHLWTKIYYFNGAHLLPQWITEADDGGFALSGVSDLGITVVRTDADGNVRWTKAYALPSPRTTYYYIGGILATGPDVYLSGNIYLNEISSGNGEYSTPVGFVTDINDADGATRWTRQYTMNNSYIAPRDIHLYGGNLMMNSTVGATVQHANNTIHMLDLNGIPIRSTTLSTPGVTYGLERSTLLPMTDGELYLMNSGTETLPLQPGFAYHSLFIKLDQNQNATWALEYGHYTGGKYFFPVLGQNNTLAALGNEIGKLIDPWRSFSNKLMFKKVDDAAPDGTFNLPCDFFQTTVNSNPETVTAQPLSWTIEASPAAAVKDTILNVYTVYTQVRYECPEFIDSCSFFKLSGTKSVCDLSGHYTYRIHRNSACGEPIQWDLPANVRLLGQTDSTVTLKFPAFGNYRIASNLPYACSPLADSLFVTAASGIAPLNLGNDTTVCPNTSFLLHAGNRFLRYQWQDGSTDSVYRVNAPGKYIVEVADSCDNLLRDTVIVSSFSDIAVDAGPDRIKCNADTLHLSAPPGYLSYSWSPYYSISGLNTQQVIINPPQDTSYVIKAEKLPGCFAYDTVHITVNHSPAILLGPDRNLCTGDSLVLDAGVGFVQYQWSTGSTTQQIAVYDKSSILVRATAANGCTSTDTLNIRNVVPLPVANLDHSSGLCTGELRALTAAPGYNYRWGDGSSGQRLLVSDTGTYYLTVTDVNGCLSRDSVRITTFLPVPVDFLPADTAICSYGKIELTTSGQFYSYLWSNGSASPAIMISKPGLYWLEATDNNYCIGRDSILVAPKDCIEGFYIPNAFTPGGSTNNLFRPLLFGNIVKYEFAIYDRWGQLIFQSNLPGSGWDGTCHGISSTPGVYAWYCRFMLDGQPQQVERGTVLLIR